MTNRLLNHSPARRSPRGVRLLAMIFAALAMLLSDAAAGVLSSTEQEFANLLVNASGQRRDRARMKPDERLVSVARARARDMAQRDYFDHTNPDGSGPNWLVKQAGYPLPAHYTSSRSLNYIESIAGGTASAQSTWSNLIGSSAHKRHLLAEDSFYRDQTTYGIGHYYSASSRYKHYWVIITAPSAGPDALAVVSPAAGARVTRDSLTVSGKSAGTDFLSAIQVRVENSTGSGVWRNVPVPAGQGGTWSVTLAGLLPGANTIRVRTLGSDGTPLHEIARTVRYAVLKPLVVSTEGAGAVTDGFAGVTQREVGMQLTIKARPAAGQILDRWEGLPDSPPRDPLAQTQSFVMQEGLALLAVFVPSPYIGREGAYQGLIAGGDAAGTGLLNIQLAASGAYTGKIKLGGVVVALKGRFNSRGETSFSIAVPGAQPVVVAMRMDFATLPPAVAANVSQGGASIALELSPSAPVSGDASVTARHTLRIEPDATVPVSPQAHGYALIKVRADGTARISGATADGRAFSAGSRVLASGAAALYVPLRRGEGAIFGNVTLPADGAAAGGTLHWLNPARPAARRHATAFSSAHVLTGSRYAPPAPGEPAVQLSADPNTGELILFGGDITGTLAQRVLVDGQNRVLPAAPGGAGLSVRVNPANGRFSGTFTTPAGQPRPISGAVLQEQHGAWGFFVGAEQSGSAELLPLDD